MEVGGVSVHEPSSRTNGGGGGGSSRMDLLKPEMPSQRIRSEDI